MTTGTTVHTVHTSAVPHTVTMLIHIPSAPPLTQASLPALLVQLTDESSSNKHHTLAFGCCVDGVSVGGVTEKEDILKINAWYGDGARGGACC